MHEGKCFNCHERGYLSVDCCKKKKSDHFLIKLRLHVNLSLNVLSFC